jgi:hypothetical protein
VRRRNKRRDPVLDATADVLADAVSAVASELRLTDRDAAGILQASRRHRWPVDRHVADRSGVWLWLRAGDEHARLWLAGASRPLPPAGWTLTDVAICGTTLTLTFRNPHRPRRFVRVHCDAVRAHPAACH